MKRKADAHAKTQRRKGLGNEVSAQPRCSRSETLCVFAPLREPKSATTRRGERPTFALLREKRRLRVRNPENGARFTISLRDWQAMLWAVRVHPEPQWRQAGNAYTTAHRIMARGRIEDWLAQLRLG